MSVLSKQSPVSKPTSYIRSSYLQGPSSLPIVSSTMMSSEVSSTEYVFIHLLMAEARLLYREQAAKMRSIWIIVS